MPPTHRIRILPEANADFHGIVEYIHQDSPQNAASVAQRLMDGIDSLNELPHRYKVHRSNRDPSRVVRALSVPPFIIYYRVDDEQHLVEILAIRRGARRQPSRFY